MSTRKTARPRKAGQRNAQRGTSHVGSGDVVVLGLSAARALIRAWREIAQQRKLDEKEAMVRGMPVTAGVLLGTAQGIETCIGDIRRRMERAKKRQPQHNVGDVARGGGQHSTQSKT